MQEFVDEGQLKVPAIVKEDCLSVIVQKMSSTKRNLKVYTEGAAWNNVQMDDPVIGFRASQPVSEARLACLLAL